MMKIKRAVLAICGLPFVAYQSALQSSPLDEVAKSHIEGNAPAPSEFDRFLKRDLTAYFARDKGRGVAVYYKFLRQGATQSGVSNPKYYLWVGLYRQNKVVESGAVRVAAIEQKFFEVTDYLSSAQIRQNPTAIETVFPQPVCLTIRQQMK